MWNISGCVCVSYCRYKLGYQSARCYKGFEVIFEGWLVNLLLWTIQSTATFLIWTAKYTGIGGTFSTLLNRACCFWTYIFVGEDACFNAHTKILFAHFKAMPMAIWFGKLLQVKKILMLWHIFSLHIVLINGQLNFIVL